MMAVAGMAGPGWGAVKYSAVWGWVGEEVVDAGRSLSSGRPMAGPVGRHGGVGLREAGGLGRMR